MIVSACNGKMTVNGQDIQLTGDERISFSGGCVLVDGQPYPNESTMSSSDMKLEVSFHNCTIQKIVSTSDGLVARLQDCEVGRIRSSSGKIIARGGTIINAKSDSGDIKCQMIAGEAKTQTGNINGQIISSGARTTSGEIAAQILNTFTPVPEARGTPKRAPPRAAPSKRAYQPPVRRYVPSGSSIPAIDLTTKTPTVISQGSGTRSIMSCPRPRPSPSTSSSSTPGPLHIVQTVNPGGINVVEGPITLSERRMPITTPLDLTGPPFYFSKDPSPSPA